MKHKREVKIKDSRLRAIRNNLREILYLEWTRRSLAIIKAQSDVLDARLPRDEMLRLHRELQVKLGEHHRIIMPTIVVCGWCSHRDKDAIYNPSNRQWFCPNCYREHAEDILSATSFIY